MLQITIRERVGKTSNTLYLDYYKDNRRIVKSLGITFNPDSKSEKELAYFQAQLIKDKIIKDNLDSGLSFQYFEENYNDSNIEETTRLNRKAYLHSILSYDNKATLQKVDRKWMIGYVEWLKNKGLKDSTINIYTTYIKSVLNEAIKRGLVKSTENLDRISPRMNEANREFLTMDEIRVFKEYKPKRKLHREIQRAFLFSCFTGLRISDIKKLKYSDIKNGILHITMKKTKSDLTLPLTRNALNLISMGSEGFVFNIDCKHTSTINNAIRLISKGSGINKHLSFHCSRHTFAVNALKFGGDLFVVSKMLGHHKLESTQKYLHCLNSDKERVLDLIPTI